MPRRGVRGKRKCPGEGLEGRESTQETPLLGLSLALLTLGPGHFLFPLERLEYFLFPVTPHLGDFLFQEPLSWALSLPSRGVPGKRKFPGEGLEGRESAQERGSPGKRKFPGEGFLGSHFLFPLTPAPGAGVRSNPSPGHFLVPGDPSPGQVPREPLLQERG